MSGESHFKHPKAKKANMVYTKWKKQHTVMKVDSWNFYAKKYQSGFHDINLKISLNYIFEHIYTLNFRDNTNNIIERLPIPETNNAIEC